MRITRFYCPTLTAELTTENDVFSLPDAVHRHAIQVLRLKQGDSVRLFDGAGMEVNAVLESVSKRASTVQIMSQREVDNESPLNITLFQAISRGDRMDYAIQKAVELGVRHIIPIATERCNVQLSSGRSEKRWSHWHGVLVSACEQSGRSYLPAMSDIQTLEEALSKNKLDYAITLDPMASVGFTSLKKHQNIGVLIGPEGGLSDDEIERANQAGFQSVALGPRILRTETATAAVLAILQTIWGDLG